MATLEERKTEYDAHKIAGQDQYNIWRAQASLDIEGGSITLDSALERERVLNQVKLDVCIGDWKTALNHLHNTLPNVHVPQSYLDALISDCQTYITNNYSW